MIDIPDTKARLAAAGPGWLRIKLRQALEEIERLRLELKTRRPTCEPP